VCIAHRLLVDIPAWSVLSRAATRIGLILPPNAQFPMQRYHYTDDGTLGKRKRRWHRVRSVPVRA